MENIKTFEIWNINESLLKYIWSYISWQDLIYQINYKWNKFQNLYEFWHFSQVQLVTWLKVWFWNYDYKNVNTFNDIKSLLPEDLLKKIEEIRNEVIIFDKDNNYWRSFNVNKNLQTKFLEDLEISNRFSPWSSYIGNCCSKIDWFITNYLFNFDIEKWLIHVDKSKFIWVWINWYNYIYDKNEELC